MSPAAEPLPPAEAEPAPRFVETIDAEMNDALSDASLDALMLSGTEGVGGEPLEAESQQTGRVAAIRRDEVFVEFGGREQGCLPLRQFDSPPEARRRRSRWSCKGSIPTTACTNSVCPIGPSKSPTGPT